MTATIFIEGGGGGNSKFITIGCQKAFRELLNSMRFEGPKPKLRACGGRDSVFRDFCTEHQTNRGYVAMWIDSEEPMADIEKAWKHLAEVTTVTPWKKPKGAVDDQVLFMTTCMESWIVADRATLRQHYNPKQSLDEKALPATNNLEGRLRNEIQQALKRATKDCTNGYAKGKRSFEIFEKLDLAILKQHLPSFVRVNRILKAKLS